MGRRKVESIWNGRTTRPWCVGVFVCCCLISSAGCRSTCPSSEQINGLGVTRLSPADSATSPRAPAQPELGQIRSVSLTLKSPSPEHASVLGNAGTQPADGPQAAAPAIPLPVAEYPIDLEAALALAGAENPTIALAREVVQAGLAEELQARTLLLPTVQAGANLDVHRGNLESSQGIIRDVDRQALYVGAGARAIGAGPVAIPGVRVTAHLADAIFAPLAAQQHVAGRRFEASAVENAVLLDVVMHYLALVGAEARLQAIHQSEAELDELVALTANFARTGQGREGDAERARSEALLLHAQEQSAQEELAVIAVDFARLLDLDPTVRLRGPGGAIPVIQLIDLDDGLESLMQIALGNRPEIGAGTAEIARSETHLRQEQVRPFIPFLSVGFSAGEFGGGSDQADTRFGRFGSRTDFDALAVWSFENLGLGNLLIQRRARMEVSEAFLERARIIDQIRREVAEAYAVSAARRREVDVARQRVETAQRAYRSDLDRSKNLQGRLIEVLNSLNLLNAARQDLIRTMIGHDQAQFQLFVALGRPPGAGLTPSKLHP
jgi:outer membrane protein TolC